jgi:glycyl-tRNA synthetase beta chain
MPEFFIELFSEEIPARMQQAAGQELQRICMGAFAELLPRDVRVFYGPRRIALAVTIATEKPGGVVEARGPRDSAPEAALAGFLNKYSASREDVVAEGGYFWLRRNELPVPAAVVITSTLGAALAKFSWPKSMRWGQGGEFTWVRPLRRVVCLLDGEVVPVTLGPVTAGNETEGHRVHAPGAFVVSSAAAWVERLRAHYVIADQDERRGLISEGVARKAAALGLSVAEDSGLLDEVTGLVEWPVPLIGRIDEKFMDLPPEVRELSMKINQKYFALRDADGNPAPHFAFVANLAAEDDGQAIIAGNERVLRARLSDARHFWDLDRKTPLNELLTKLEKITFHAKIGTQRQRADRIAALAGKIADELNADGYESKQSQWAGLLCKADLVTGMVGEFPELQGVMGGYYAERSYRGWDGKIVGPAIKTHYQPKGPGDAVPVGVVPVSVALADKIDTLVEFFRIDEKPTGSGDPYALRRAALGVIRIILENNLRRPLKTLLGGDASLFDFIIERLRVKLRGEGKRFDVLDAVLAAGADDDLVRLMKRVDALGEMLGTDDGRNLLAAYRRAANILRIEQDKNQGQSIEFVGVDVDEDNPPAHVDQTLLVAEDEKNLHRELVRRMFSFQAKIEAEHFTVLMSSLAELRPFIDTVFQNVTINVPEPELRLNRLRLLAEFRNIVHQIADFSKIEG